MSESDVIPAELIFEHRPWLLTVVRSRLRCDLAEAEDLFASWLVEILAAPPTWAQVKRLEPWLYRVFVNRSVDWFRSRQRHQRREAELLADPIWVADVSERQIPPLEVLLRGEQQIQLQQVLQQLPDEELEILQLKYTHDWNYRQLANHLGLGHDQIVYRLRNARLHLKTLLQRSCYWPEMQALRGEP